MNPLAIGSIIESVGKIADDLITTDKERSQANLDAYKAETDRYQAETTRLQGQIEINKIEASSESLFKSGWRPAIGWIGAMAMFWQFILYPLCQWSWVTLQAGGYIPRELPPPPMIDSSELWVILTGILGLGVYRTAEKIKGK